jgi:phosphoribosylformimino-5-aminoimidazole carboxamide ribotide isomerase
VVKITEGSLFQISNFKFFMFIIPAIDLIEGKAVRLTQGDYNQKKVYNEDPLEVAKEFEGAGLRRLHLVDLDGAKAGHIINHRVLERIAAKTSLTIDFGGGLKSNKEWHGGCQKSRLVFVVVGEFWRG